MIDNSAKIHKSAKIAQNVTIGANVVIGEDVEIGEGSNIIANCYIEHTKIGKRCTISPFSTIGTAPQDLSYNGEKTKVIIGDDTIIKENVTIHRASSSGDLTTRIGNKCLLMVGFKFPNTFLYLHFYLSIKLVFSKQIKIILKEP